MLTIVFFVTLIVAAYLLYTGHVQNNQTKLIIALVLTLGGLAGLYYVTGGNL